jgi:DnaJ-class molecular chaperone
MSDPDMAPGDDAPPENSQTAPGLCPDCDGSGRGGDGECPTCKGTGRVEEAVGGG